MCMRKAAKTPPPAAPQRFQDARMPDVGAFGSTAQTRKKRDGTLLTGPSGIDVQGASLSSGSTLLGG